MAKLLIAACAALFLLGAIVANPLNRKLSTTVSKHLDLKETMKEIIYNLKKVKGTLSKNTLSSSLVAKVIIDKNEKNLTIEKLACRGVKALNLSNPDAHIVKLNRSLALISKGVDCEVNSDESYDLQSFIDELLSEFQKHFTKHLHKPSY